MDALDTIASADPKEIIALLLWKDRFRNPDMAVQITEQDITKFRACTDYLEVRPTVSIHRPQGRPAHPRAPATATRSAIPPSPAESPRPFVVVQLLDQDGHAFKPIENNDEDAKTRDQSNELRKYRERGASIASQLIGELRSGTIIDSTIMEAAQALAALARA